MSNQLEGEYGSITRGSLVVKVVLMPCETIGLHHKLHEDIVSCEA